MLGAVEAHCFKYDNSKHFLNLERHVNSSTSQPQVLPLKIKPVLCQEWFSQVPFLNLHPMTTSTTKMAAITWMLKNICDFET
jgi:hypothetical protein